MSKDYQQIADKVFGSFYRHRTLRTVFDPFSTEWNDTSSEQKIEILKKLLNSNKITLPEILGGYKHYYKHELVGKAHVVDSLPDGFSSLLAYSLK